MANQPRIALILTGGTIDSVGKDRLDLAWYIEAGKRLQDGELLQQLPELKEIADVQEITFRRLPSHAGGGQRPAADRRGRSPARDSDRPPASAGPAGSRRC